MEDNDIILVLVEPIPIRFLLGGTQNSGIPVYLEIATSSENPKSYWIISNSTGACMDKEGDFYEDAVNDPEFKTIYGFLSPKEALECFNKFHFTPAVSINRKISDMLNFR